MLVKVAPGDEGSPPPVVPANTGTHALLPLRKRITRSTVATHRIRLSGESRNPETSAVANGSLTSPTPQPP